MSVLIGTVTRIGTGPTQVWVSVPRRATGGLSIGPMEVATVTGGYSVGDRVILGQIQGGAETYVVLGRIAT